MFDFKIINSKETYKMVDNKNYEYNYRIGDLQLLFIYHKVKYFDLIQETKIINEDDIKNEVIRFEEMLKAYRLNIDEKELIALRA